jgi:hypothetical protein
MTTRLTTPYPRTATKRKGNAQEARKVLAEYRNLAGEAQYENGAFFRLGWALAWLDRTLYFQTRGAYGDANALPADTLARFRNYPR